jgi:hypothetical protein
MKGFIPILLLALPVWSVQSVRAQTLLQSFSLGSNFGYAVSSAGDVNNDGYNDVMVGSFGMNTYTGRVDIFFGGVSMDNIPDVTMTGETTISYFGYSLSSAGDVNGDGFDDVVVGAYRYGSSMGRSYIYFGGTTMNNIADVTLSGEADSQFGYAVSAAGDLNEDGYDDVVVGANKYSTSTGRAYIYYGSDNMDNIADDTLTGEANNNQFGCDVSSTGDVNGDGHDDIVIGALNYNLGAGRAYIYYGGGNLANTADAILDGESSGIYFGINVSAAGDVNDDGYDDVAVGASGYNTNTGRVYIFFGGNSMETTADVTFTGEASGSFFGYSLSAPGDINNDGYGDVMVGAYRYNSTTGRVYVYHGGSSMDNTADIIMNGVATGNGYGLSVSAAGDVNNDGCGDIIIGAYYALTAYVYSLNPLPALTTQAVTDITASTATGHGSISLLGSGNPTAHGVCWNTAGTPTTADFKTDEGGRSTTGSFTSAIPGLTPNTTYYLRAYATNGSGTGYGMEVTFTTLKANQSISFGTLTDVTYGADVFDLTATATSGLPVTYTSSDTNVAVVSGKRLTVAGAGITTITASQAGNNAYHPAEDVMQTLTVSKTTLNVSAEDTSKTYGDANPVFKINFDGFVSGDDTADLIRVPVASSVADAATGAGTATITVSGGVSDNYDFSYLNGTLTINKAPLTVAADDQSKTYGDANPDFTLSYDGFVNGEDTDDLTTLPTSGCLADATTGTGTEAITVSGGSAGNYRFIYVNGILTINKADLTVAAEDKNRSFGEDNPVFTLAYDGFVNNDTQDDLNVLPVVTTDATAQSPAGSYTLVASGGSDNNYEFTYVNGTLVITAATSDTYTEAGKLSAYPNPAGDYIIVNCDKGMNENIAIYNNAGRLVMNTKLYDQRIDISSLDPGIYLMKVQGLTLKFIKE